MLHPEGCSGRLCKSGPSKTLNVSFPNFRGLTTKSQLQKRTTRDFKIFKQTNKNLEWQNSLKLCASLSRTHLGYHSLEHVIFSTFSLGYIGAIIYTPDICVIMRPWVLGLIWKCDKHSQKPQALVIVPALSKHGDKWGCAQSGGELVCAVNPTFR